LASQVDLTKGAVQHIEGGVGCLDTLLALADQLGLVLVGTNLTGDGDLGSRLLALRKKRGYISQREFADVSKITAPTLRRIESGNTSVQLAKVVGYATFLGVTLSLQPNDKTVVSHADHRTTPQDFALALAEVVGGQWDVDPASPGPELCHIPALRHITAAQDGLAQPWGRGADGMGLAANVWVNPPYGRSKGGYSMRDWLTKAVAEVDSGRARMVVALIMATPGTAYWRELIVERGAFVRFVTGRLKFDGLKSGADFDSAVVVFGGTADDHQRVDEAVANWENSRPSARKAAGSQSKMVA
jgi:transcriptional regulator with XRE-family HTH domain